MNVIKNITKKTSLKCPLAMTPNRIIVHNTANDASARKEVDYMINNSSSTSFHYAVDDIEVVQGIEENRNSWNAGDGTKGIGNTQGISIEICYSKSGGDKFIKAEKNAVDLIIDILKRYKWDISKVTKHQDYSKKYCPHRTLDIGWQRFLNMISVKLSPVTKPIEKPPVKPYWYALYITTSRMNVRATPSIFGSINKVYPKGTEFNIHEEKNGWGHTPSRIYLPTIL